MSGEITYETRAIAFLDILGWRDAVERSVDDAELRGRLHNAVWALGTLATADAEDGTPEQPSYDRVSQISDTVIVSIPFVQALDLWRLIRQVATYQGSMLMSGFLLRGGITVGPLFHEGSLVFGPALNTACELEKRAVTPRVLIDESLGSQVLKAGTGFPKGWAYVITDSDGSNSPDYLMGYAKSQSATAKIEKVIGEGLTKFADDPKTLAKYLWLNEKWLQAKALAGE